jgi:alanyl-tRNA synthetase
MNSKELRQKFIDFMVSKNHAVIPSGSLVPQEDPTVLFINSGMQPLIPYLTGMEKHPLGTRLVNSQKSLRTEDIDEVGDNRHGTFFEMLGFWSIGDYFKKEAIEWTFEFLTDPQWLGLDPNRLYATVYKGSEVIGADNEAAEVWKQQFEKVGIQADIGDEYDFENPHKNDADQKYVYRITRKSGKDNWWGLPYRGPCGPCAEMYYILPGQPTDFQESVFPRASLEEIEDFIENKLIEIGNNVFMTYEGEKTSEKEPRDIVPLAAKNIDTGLGFERLLMMVQDKDTMFETDALRPIADVAEKWASQ